MTSVQDILNELRSGTDSANAANQARLDEILNLLTGTGESAKVEAGRASAERTAGGDQSLMNRGLFNTTILDSQRRREGEGLTREINNIDTNVALQKAGVLERVTDQGPDMNTIMALLSQLGQGQGGQSGGGFNFGGINRLSGNINDSFGGSVGGGGGSGGGGSNVQTITNPNAGGGDDPFSGQSIQDLQSGAQESAGNRSESDSDLPVIPRTTWFQSRHMRVSGDFVYNINTGQLLGRKGN